MKVVSLFRRTLDFCARRVANIPLKAAFLIARVCCCSYFCTCIFHIGSILFMRVMTSSERNDVIALLIICLYMVGYVVFCQNHEEL